MSFDKLFRVNSRSGGQVRQAAPLRPVLTPSDMEPIPASEVIEAMSECDPEDGEIETDDE